jgi:hypothetical protein
MAQIRWRGIIASVLASVLGFLLTGIFPQPAAKAQDFRQTSSITESKREEIPGRTEQLPRQVVVNLSGLSKSDPMAVVRPLKWNPEMEPESITHDLPVPFDVPLPPDAPLSTKTSSKAVTTSSATATQATLAASFRALPDDSATFPPDTTGAVGPNHVMATLNGQIRIQSKNGTVIKTLWESTFWAPLKHSDIYDPKVLYDPFANRWMFTMLADRNSAGSSVMMAVSQTSDPTGNWNLFNIDADPSNVLYADFPSMGFTKDWIVVQVNMYRVGAGTPNSSEVLVFNKSNLYSGTVGAYKIFPLAPGFGGTQAPAITYDNTVATAYLLQDWNGNSTGGGYLRIYTITGPVGYETLTATGLYPASSNAWAYQPAAGYAADFAPQLGSNRKIHTLDSRMRNVVYRNGSLWTTHTVYLPADAPTRCAVQWWEVNPATGAVRQFGRLDDPSGGNFYAFPSIAVNKNNDFLLGYASFATSRYAGAGYAFHSGLDAPNTLRTDTTLKAGEGPYANSSTYGISGANRWGDSSNTVIDPTNDTDFWTLQEYAGVNNTWSTWWGNLVPTGTTPVATTVRIDSGGNQYVDSLGNIWGADAYFQNGTLYAPASLNSTDILNTTDDVLYRSERYGGAPGSAPLAYAIPIANGTYTVRLLFAETWYGVGTTGGVGSRVFDVSLENTPVLTNFDIYAAAGGPLKAVVKTFSVTVADGLLNLSASGNYPKFNAIEVVPGSSAPVVPEAPAGLTATAGNSQVALSWTAVAGANTYNIKRAAVSGGPYTTIASGITTSLYSDTGLINGSPYYYVISAVNAVGEGSNSAQASATPLAPTTFSLRVNSGGAKYVDGLGNTWLADAYFQNGSVYAPASLNTTDILSTTDDVLYRSERFGGASGSAPLAYAIPIANGTYTVRLLFAETWYGVGATGGAGSRVFNVSIENATVLTNFDIYAAAGGPLRAVVKTFSVTVSDGVLNLSASGSYPKFNAIEVVGN